MDFAWPGDAAAFHAAVDDGEVTYPHPELMAHRPSGRLVLGHRLLARDPERAFPAPNVIEGVLSSAMST